MESKKQEIDLSSWKRREHFAFFRQFHDPCYSVTSRVDCTDAYHFCKSKNYSFFLSCLYWTLKAAQELEAFRLRLEGEKLFLYERIDAGSAVDKPDETFGYGYFIYDSDIGRFIANAAEELEKVRNSSGLNRSDASNVIRYSSLPWIDFTSITHAQVFPEPDTFPRITFGKMTEVEGRRSMPVSIHVNHALIDGRDVGKFLELFQNELSCCLSKSSD